ncbi:BZ3500_MvSof-1268-A1-R1_Chr2-3g05301 [Microbotryum saponariae]|uniref:BZ3500_MvSof-1268-A1-R1_Chr2-3g05301 protein n=1 Tax=Microbotryum saponariae TaxID=289078 RepID=A0A2X0LXB1_9BASI|nr:BZ3500_MvSof-1268-A1-R1_Chr2-3g05301 [Microbotryum saponariae]SDA01155.1 BZ3501_MvSof-1269-A2-R1_Chr2-2g04974 [Microbotryum saponariae]
MSTPDTTTTSNNPYTHTRALLSYLFSTYSTSPSNSNKHGLASSSSPPSSSTSSSAPAFLSLTSSSTQQLELSVRRLALAQSRAHSQVNSASSNSNSGTSNASASEEDDDDAVDDDDSQRESQDDEPSTNEAAVPSAAAAVTDDGNTTPSGRNEIDPIEEQENRVRSVIRLLGNDSIDEDDKPEEIKRLLLSSLVAPNDSQALPNLDPIILSLLHRYREDLHPSGNPLPPLPNHGSTTPSSRPSVSRSSSFRRNLPSGQLGVASSRGPSNPTAASIALSSSVSSTSSRSAPTSPFQTASPSLGSSARHTPSHSPWSSPRPMALSLAMSANAPEFKFSAGATEFRPGGATSSFSLPGASSPLIPGTPDRAQLAQANWALANSPLGTPKLGTAPPSNGEGSNVSSPSYFPRNLPLQTLHSKLAKPVRLPWQQDDDDDENPEEPKNYDDPPGGPGQPYNPGPGGPSGYAGGPMWDRQVMGEGQRRFVSGPPTFVPRGQSPAWDPQHQGRPAQGGWDFIDGEGFADPSTPTLEDGSGMLLPDMMSPGDASSIEFANSLVGASGLGAMGAYSMTPFDHLYSIFASSNISPELVEDVLVQTGYDVDQAIEYLIENPQLMNGSGGEGSGFGLLPGVEVAPMNEVRTTVAASGSRPVIMSRDSYDAYLGGRGGAFGGPQQQRWPGQHGGMRGPDPSLQDSGRGVGGRVCRYYLAGNCLRSDCKFSHDVGKAVCKFWLRGHCLKGDGRCDFLHSIPPIMRADFEARARRRDQGGYDEAEHMARDDGPDVDFPTLGEMQKNRRGMPGIIGGRATVVLDPARTRFSGAVKMGPKYLPSAMGQPARPPGPPTMAGGIHPRDSLPRPRPSARIPLRPPALLPTLPTGPALAALYLRYRSSFLELGAKRNKCLARASECFKKGDGAGARKFSREAQDWGRQVSIEGRDAAARILAERKRLLKEAILEGGTRGSTEDVADRRVRGREMGGTICLGVVAQMSVPRHNSGGDIHDLRSEERTEVALDLHGLHTDEAISFLGDSLMALERERFQGIAFYVIGQARHSGKNAGDAREAAGRLRLEQACCEFLSDQGWAWQMFSGVLAVDALR